MNATAPLQDRTVVVPGGTGNVGEGVVRALLSAGARVVVPSRSEERLTELRTLIGRPLDQHLVTIAAPYDSFDAAEQLAVDVTTQVGPVTDVIALIGGWWAGKNLWEIDQKDWDSVFISPATTGMALVRAFIPRLTAAGTYTLIAGFSSYTAEPGSGPVSMQGAAQLMMRRTLSKEIGHGPRINDLMLGPIINRNRPQGRKQWLNADEVGLVLVRVLSDPAVRDTLVDVQTRDSFDAFVNGQRA